VSTNNDNEFDFSDLTPIAISGIKVPYDKPDGTVGVKDYIMREATEGVVIQYESSSARQIKFKDGKPSALQGTGEAGIVLLTGCLFEIYQHKGETKERPVILEEVRGWLHRITEPLIEKAKQISRIGVKDTPESLRKQINVLQNKLKTLTKGGPANDGEDEEDKDEEDTEAKNSSGAMTGRSA